MLKVGITGPMGSGKSYVSHLFEKMGVPLYNCDENSKNLVSTNKELIEKIKNEFGKSIYNGNINANLAKIVFSDDSKLNKLTELIYPYLFEDLNLFYELNSDAKFCLVETAILYETKMQEKLDKVLFIIAPEDICIKRAIERSGISEQDYKNRMKNQIDSTEKIKLSNFIIYNNDLTQSELLQQIEHIYNFYSK